MILLYVQKKIVQLRTLLLYRYLEVIFVVIVQRRKIMSEKTYNIGVEATMEIIGGKWKPLILCHLRNGSLRSSELLRKIPNISQKVLTEQLRELENNDIINRKIFQEVPPHVEYGLSEYGNSLNKILNLLCTWGENNIDRRNENGESITILNRDNVEI